MPLPTAYAVTFASLRARVDWCRCVVHAALPALPTPPTLLTLLPILRRLPLRVDLCTLPRATRAILLPHHYLCDRAPIRVPLFAASLFVVPLPVPRCYYRHYSVRITRFLLFDSYYILEQFSSYLLRFLL